jgi:hypothetical protein
MRGSGRVGGARSPTCATTTGSGPAASTPNGARGPRRRGSRRTRASTCADPSTRRPHRSPSATTRRARSSRFGTSATSPTCASGRGRPWAPTTPSAPARDGAGASKPWRG